MKIGRNDPCPCGSGKKYKKCCLEKDEAEARRQAAARLLEEKRARAAAEAAYGAILERQEELEREPAPDARASDSESSAPGGPVEPRPTRAAPPTIDGLPPLSDIDQRRVEDWWDRVDALYQAAASHPSQLQAEISGFVQRFPHLFPYLRLDGALFSEMEFGFLARRDDRAYLDFLLFLRRELPSVYARCPERCDYLIVAQLMLIGRRSEAPEHLGLFKQPHQASPEYLSRLARMLAWCGLERALSDLATARLALCSEPEHPPLAAPLASWLAWREFEPYARMRDATPQAARTLAETLAGKPFAGLALADPTVVERRLRWLCGEDARSFELPAFEWEPDRLEEVTDRFCGFLYRGRRLAWSRAVFLAGCWRDFGAWRQAQASRPSWFNSDPEFLSRYLAEACLAGPAIDGCQAMATVQAGACFARFLEHAGAWTAESVRIALAFCETVHDSLLQALEPADPAPRLYRSFEALTDFRVWGDNTAPRWSEGEDE